MTNENLINEYFDWMYQLVCSNRNKRLSYRKLFCQLFDTEFIYILGMDSNRADDGINLRYRFGYECHHPDPMIATLLDNRPCSVLEMMIALSMRCEENIMVDPDVGDRIGQWFWNMIVSLGLGSMSDGRYDKNYVADVLERFINREYERNGHGGLFTVEYTNTDMRTAEIWTQMHLYLGEFQ